MGKSNTISVIVDIKAYADNLNKVIQQSKKNLQTLSPNIDPKQANALMKQFDNLQLRIENTRNKLASGLNSQAAFSKASQDVRRFGEEYKGVIQKIEGLGIDPKSIIPDTQAVQTGVTKLENLFEKQGKIIGQKFGKGISKDLNKELKNAAKAGNSQEIQNLGKKAASELTASKRGLIAQRGQITKFYGKDAKAVIEAEISNQRNILATQGQAAQQAQAQKFGKNIGQLEKDLGIVNQHQAYKEQHKAITEATQDYSKQAIELNNLQIEIDETTGKIKLLAQPARDEAANALKQLSGSTNEVTTSLQGANTEIEKGGVELNKLSTKAKSLQQFKSYFNYFFSIGTIINTTSRAIRSAIRDFSELDKQFNEISIVTGKSMEELWGQFGNLNKIAQEYGVQTKNVVSVQKLYYQQGRSMAEVTRLTGETLKFARISGLDYAEATDYMTASLNAYKIAAEDASKITDTFAALSSTAAVDANEVAVAMSKVASLAAGAGSSFEDTSAYLAKIIETTREAPETAGTALKTIIARFTEVKDLTEEEAALLDEDFNFNNIEKALKTVGIESKDARGQLRGFSDILNDLGPIWEDLSTNQQRYIATAAAGARQQSRFIALMDDWGRTQELQSTAMDSAGIGTKQLALAMDSVETATNRLKSSWQEFYANFLDSGMIKKGINLLNELLGVMNDLIDVPVFGPAIIATSIVTMVKLVKMAKGWGATFAKSFNEGRDSTEKVYSTARTTRERAEAVVSGATSGVKYEHSYYQAANAVREAYENLERVEKQAEAVANGTMDGTVYQSQYEAARARVAAAEQLFNKQVPPSIFQKSGKWFGKTFQTIKDSDFMQGMFHPIKTHAANGGYRAAQISQLGGAAGPAMAQNTGLMTMGGSVVGGGAASGAAIAGTIVGGAAIAAIIAVILKKAIMAVQADMEKKILKATEESSENISTSVDKITKISDNYTTALELQRKGLARSEEEMEKYNSSLQALKETYPQMIKTLSDGSLELVANADSMYSQILEKERENIRQQSDAQYERALKGQALSAGVALTQESMALQEGVKTTAANLSSLDKDSLKELGLKGVKLDKLSGIAEKGINRTTLNEAIGRDMGIARYNELFNAMEAGGGYDRGENSKEWRFMEYLAKQNGLTIQELAETLKKGAGLEGVAEQEAKALAKSYASEVGTTLSSVTEAGAIKVMQADKDTGEKKIESYFRIAEKKREEFERDVNGLVTSMTIGEAQTIMGLKDAGLESRYGFTEGAADFAEGVLEAQEETFNETLQHQIDKYKDATGKTFGKATENGIEISNEYFKSMTLTEIEGYVDTIAKITNTYGKKAAQNFEAQYRTFRDEVLTGNTKLQEEFSKMDFMDNQSISQFGARIAQQFGIASEEYKRFIAIVQTGSSILDRSFRTADQTINDVATDIETLQDKMKTLGEAASGELGLSDMFRLISDSQGLLDFSDFTATAKGYQLAQDKISETRERLVELKLLEYKMEIELNKAQIAGYKAELLSEENTAKLKKVGIELNKAELELFLAQYEVSIETGKVLDGNNKKIFKALEETGLLLNATYAIQLKQTNEALAKVDEYVSKINYDWDNANTAVNRTIKKLEKLVELMKGIGAYSDIDAYLKDIENKLAEADFTIEFSTNLDTVEDAIVDKFNLINEQISANLAKSQYAEERATGYRGILEGQYGGYVSFDDSGNLLTNGDAIYAWQQKIAELYGSEDTEKQAEAEEKKYETLLDNIDAYREEKELIDDSKKAAKDLLKQVEEFNKQLRENVVELENTFRDLFIARDEEILENLEERYDKMKEMDDDYLEAVRDAIEEERRLRDQNEAYEDVSKMERQLALLQMSGGSAVEIQKLQEEIKKARQDIADSEQDAILENIEKENETRATAMDEEVEYHRTVLEQKKEDQRLYNEEIKTLLQQDKQVIISTWKSLDKEYAVASEVNKTLMMANMDALVTKGLASSKQLSEEGIKGIEVAYTQVKTAGIDQVDSAMRQYVDYVNQTSGGVVSKIDAIKNAYTNAATAVGELAAREAELNRVRAENDTKTVAPTVPQISAVNTPGSNAYNFKQEQINNKLEPSGTGYSEYHFATKDSGWFNKSNYGGRLTQTINGKTYVKAKTSDYWYDTRYLEENPENSNQVQIAKGTLAAQLTSIAPNEATMGYYFKESERGKIFKIYISSGTSLKPIEKTQKSYFVNNKSQFLYLTDKGMYLPEELFKKYGISTNFLSSLPISKKYAQGGMVDFTGPAWVDGTKSRPEAFLSANDTQLIASLRDVLRAGITPTAFAATSLQKGGDTYYTIHINVDELGDGYSVDDLAEEIEERILQATGKSNVVKITR